MRILQINIFGNLSTGRIAADIARTLQEDGHQAAVAYARNTLAEDVQGIRIGSMSDVYKHVLMTRITDKTAFYSKQATKDLIVRIDQYQLDIIHLHNLHGYYINIEVLFSYLSKKKIPVVWTLHDCWAFTGHCVYFESVHCEKWKKGCHHCPAKHEYPGSFVFDRSKWNYQRKKELFCSVEDMTLVTPSVWLHDLVGQSFLSKYETVTIHNGIDLSVFRPSPSKEIRARYHIESDKKIILGVAGVWAPRKGLKDFVALSKALPDEYRIVVVGVSTKQVKELPRGIIGIERTDNIQELVSLYSEAFCLLNPTYEDTFPTVNLEALACGTPVVTYRTGGCPESVDKSCGRVVRQGDIEGLKNAILSIKADQTACMVQAQKFNRADCFRQYIDLYQQVVR